MVHTLLQQTYPISFPKDSSLLLSAFLKEPTMLNFLIHTCHIDPNDLLLDPTKVASTLYATRSESTIRFVLDPTNFPPTLIDRIKSYARTGLCTVDILLTGDPILIDELLAKSVNNKITFPYDVAPSSATPNEQLEYVERLIKYKVLSCGPDLDSDHMPTIKQSSERAKMVIANEIEDLNTDIDIGDEERLIYFKLSRVDLPATLPTKLRFKHYATTEYINTGDWRLIPYLLDMWDSIVVDPSSYCHEPMRTIVQHGNITQAKVAVKYLMSSCRVWDRMHILFSSDQLFESMNEADDHDRSLQVIKYLNASGYAMPMLDMRRTHHFKGTFDMLRFVLTPATKIFRTLLWMEFYNFDHIEYALNQKSSLIKDHTVQLAGRAAIKHGNLPAIHMLIKHRPALFKNDAQLQLLAISRSDELYQLLEDYQLLDFSSTVIWDTIGRHGNVKLLNHALSHTDTKVLKPLIHRMLEQAVQCSQMDLIIHCYHTYKELMPKDMTIISAVRSGDVKMLEFYFRHVQPITNKTSRETIDTYIHSIIFN
ncbi:hypothetical protein SAMD00019534_021200 [Acytostelium subglobosum LB1]|uniref:hypothetical protein n=1 Tax=Acytostelium subglobosum LB1 TaxID=1410327 RepID=UPI0006449931|nr:hypothetical protein SAMD00019534_021200 [Acytostelium subglobosum LB1]GAM18945.1 hypothetical protein SAMD00019534_021200 [Acytostelium subglobosum LB1]|eukprot:XP_012758165.1 hypothetical protein SAMD00019534_021200 [Acytostelium subglobosum LB1]